MKGSALFRLGVRAMSSRNNLFPKRIFSGIQPTGSVHLGNYLGAISNWVTLQQNSQQPLEIIISIVDLHAITVPQDPEKLRHACLELAATLIACGIDPDKTVLFTQSKIPEHCELNWILSCCTPMSKLRLMPQFKEKSKSTKNTNLGLFSYPTLQTADVLLYKTTHVPVGDDQKHHIELAREIAHNFNRCYQVEYFPYPQLMTSETTSRVMSLRDGTKKMSKSDRSDMTRINLTDDPDAIVRKIQKAKTDSLGNVTYDPENRPNVSNLISIYSGISSQSVKKVEEEFQYLSVSQFKEVLSERLIEKVCPLGVEVRTLLQDPKYLKEILGNGAQKAGEIARKNMVEIRNIVGLAE